MSTKTEMELNEQLKILDERKRIKKGDWLFTCSFKPYQFDKWRDKNPDDYNDYWRTTDDVIEWQLFFNFDDFMTLDGTNHSIMHCGCAVVSEQYALWFIENILPVSKKLWNEQTGKISYWDLIKRICQEKGVEYEGA